VALSSSELVLTRYYAGYPIAGAAPADILATKLAGLTTDEETVLRASFLVHLPVLEAAIPGAGGTLDTNEAAVWTRNPVETAERAVLFRAMRMALCRFLGVEPGAGIVEPAIIVPVPGGTPIPSPTTGGGGDGGDGDPLEKDQTYVPAVLTV
jgi:hypothetical protein